MGALHGHGGRPLTLLLQLLLQLLLLLGARATLQCAVFRGQTGEHALGAGRGARRPCPLVRRRRRVLGDARLQAGLRALRRRQLREALRLAQRLVDNVL